MPKKTAFNRPSSRKPIKQSYFDHKDTATLERFLDQFGQIQGRSRSSTVKSKPVLRTFEQKRLSQAIKRARFLALLPYVGRRRRD